MPSQGQKVVIWGRQSGKGTLNSRIEALRRELQVVVDRKDKRFFDFMCSCGEEGKERCDRVYDEVMASFDSEISDTEVTDKDFLDNVAYGLGNLSHGVAFIRGIDTDMWAGVYVNYEYDFTECEKDCNDDDCEYPKCSHKTQEFGVECDQVHHGLARIYQLVKAYDESLAA
jgi:hypothetical protein